MNITIIGTGYVGLVTGACFADAGNSVICVDLDENKVKYLNSGQIPIHEPSLDILIDRCLKRKTISFTTDIKSAINHGDILVIAVGTPSSDDGSADLTYIFSAAASIGEYINKKSIVITKSTVPVGTGDKIKSIINKKIIDRELSIDFSIVSNPEFLREGDAIRDFKNPDRVVVGTEEKWAFLSLRKLYSPFVSADRPILEMDLRSAELSKYAANAMLATRISFMNELAKLSKGLGANIELVRNSIGYDHRIGPQFLRPGCGYGGSCFPKDVKALIHAAAHDVDIEMKILQSVEDTNNSQKGLIPIEIDKYFHGLVKGKKIGVWGLSFKPDTDDIRDAPSLTIIEALYNAGALITAYDPVASQEARVHLESNGIFINYSESAKEAIIGADALILTTEWSEFKLFGIDNLSNELKGKVIFDGRNLWDLEEMYNAEVNYFSIGRPFIFANNLY